MKNTSPSGCKRNTLIKPRNRFNLIKNISLLFKKTLLATLIIFGCTHLTLAQICEQLQNEIRNSSMLQRLLPLDYTKSFETLKADKKVLERTMLADMENISDWSRRGIGGMSQSDTRSIEGKHSLRLVAPARTGVIPAPFGVGFGSSRVELEIGGANWENYNRIAFWIFPDCEGVRGGVFMTLRINNEGQIRMPDEFSRDGIHEINLINGQWNRHYLEIPEFPRDKITSISFSIDTFGRDLIAGDSLIFYIDAIELQKIENPEIASGWMPAENRIIFSTTGYGINSRKTAVVNIPNHSGRFELIDYTTNQVVYSGRVNSQAAPIGTFDIIDFSHFRTEGQYKLRVGNVVTLPFYINKNIWDNSAWRVLNFLFAQRCGFPVPGKHGTCHSDHNIMHNGQMYLLNGGWHDAGDLSQNPKQTAEIVHALFELANRHRENGNIDLSNRLIAEGLWGLDYVLRARLGGGYRIARAMTHLRTDGVIGTVDDIRNIHIRNSAWENFIYAAISAYASMSIRYDDMMRNHLVQVAKEDFFYAMERFKNVEEAPLLRGEHPLSDTPMGIFSTRVSPSQFYATISWSASMLHKLTNDSHYAQIAAEYIRYTLDTQRLEPIGNSGIRGFFYQTTAKNNIVHFNHQGEHQVFMKAMIALAETQPNHPDFNRWDNSIRVYGEYLRKITNYVQPYGMIPSGVYHIEEPLVDPVAFRVLHLGTGNKELLEDYREQLRNGFELGDGYYLRAFPVWFSFRGNAVIHLTKGKAAAMVGQYLNDTELIHIAEQQLFWTVGLNPFGQSLIWGEGSNYMFQYAPLPGTSVGQIPVGIQTRRNEDVPFWSNFNWCTFKEVWVKPAGRWLSLLAEF